MLYSFYKCLLITQLEELTEDSFKNKLPGQWCHRGLSLFKEIKNCHQREPPSLGCLSWQVWKVAFC